MYDNNYESFANAVEDRVDMSDIKNRHDLFMRLGKFFVKKDTDEPTNKQIDALADYYGVSKKKKVEVPMPPPKKIKPKRIPARKVMVSEPMKLPAKRWKGKKRSQKVGKRIYRVNPRVVRTIKKPKPNLYFTVIVEVKGFKRKQVRDVKTGRVLKWVD